MTHMTHLRQLKASRLARQADMTPFQLGYAAARRGAIAAMCPYTPGAGTKYTEWHEGFRQAAYDAANERHPLPISGTNEPAQVKEENRQ